MKFYFDESGSFRVPTHQSEHAAGVVAGVVVPENAEEGLFIKFKQFIDQLPASAFKNGEPKGNLLSNGDLNKFAKLISDTEGILVCPTILDLTTIAGKSEKIHQSLIDKMVSLIPLCKYDTMRNDVALLGRQIKKLSPQASLRLGAWAQCIKRCLLDSIIVHSADKYDNCWSNMALYIDPVQPKKGSREERVFQVMLLAWLTGWSRQDPIILINEIHTPEHPFVKKWETDDGIDFGKMFRDNIHFIDSSKCPGVQIADMAAYIIRRAIVGLATPENLHNYGVLMSKTLRSNTHAHGIFSFSETNTLDIAKRYYGIVEALAEVRRTQS